MVSCGDDNGSDGDDDGCALSAVLMNAVEGVAKGDDEATLFLAFAEREGVAEWIDEDGHQKLRVNAERVADEKAWAQWKTTYFIGDGAAEETVERMLKEFVGDAEKMKVYQRMTRHIPRYAVLRRPGEDTLVLEE